MRRSFALCLPFAATLAVLTTPVAARPLPSPMESGELVAAPPGYLAMCARAASLCDGPSDAAAAAPAPMTEKQRSKLIRKVNRHVNGWARQRPDRGERWQRVFDDGNGVGDCEDFAIQKHDMLIAAGFPRQDLFYAIGYLPTVGLHTVLVVRTAKGDLVLDSRTPWTTNWKRTSYVWLARQSSSNPLMWTTVNGGAGWPPATALAA